ncbi:MAG: hypothetical protein H8K10_15480 [Nitrospira sp.]|nr:hypothetical protein [Nitrospira sp.]
MSHQARARQAEQGQFHVSVGDVRVLQRVAGDEQGWKWEVLIIKPGLGAGRQYFPESTLRQAVSVFEGARVFCLDDEQHASKRDKSAKQIVGYIDQTRYEDGKGLVGRLNLLPTGDWLRQSLMASHHERPDLFGLSIDAPGEARATTIQQGGEKISVQEFLSIRQPATVDVVWNPGTKGGFQRALNAVATSHQPEEERMDKKQIIQILQANRPDLLTGVDLEAVSDEKLAALLAQATAKQAEEPKPQEENKPAEEKQAAARQVDDAQARQVDLRLWQWDVRQALDESKLPEACLKDLRARFMDQPGKLEQVQQAIKAEREKIDAISQSGKVSGLGFAREVAVEGSFERTQASLDKMLGVKDVKSDAPAFVGIRQAYEHITGDKGVTGQRSSYAQEYLQRMVQAARAYQAESIDEFGQAKPGYATWAMQAQLSSSWPLAMANTLYRRLSQEYAEVDYMESRIISNRRRVIDFRSVEINRINYSPDLPSVNEDTDYTELATIGEEGANYKVSKRGRIITITMETIMNDDLSAVQRMVRNEGRAARRTFARFVWNFLMSNATYDGDSVALFHASHGNLGATALTADATGVTAVVNRLNALMNQTEPGTSERLGGAWWNARPQLAVPTALQAIAKQLNQSRGIPGAANQGDNPIAGLFGNPDNPERILVNPLFTDTSDWYLLRQPTDGEMIEVGFLNGQESPELFLADNQQVGQMFMADKLQYKTRHIYGGEIADFRMMDKSVV